MVGRAVKSWKEGPRDARAEMANAVAKTTGPAAVGGLMTYMVWRRLLFALAVFGSVGGVVGIRYRIARVRAARAAEAREASQAKTAAPWHAPWSGRQYPVPDPADYIRLGDEARFLEHWKEAGDLYQTAAHYAKRARSPLAVKALMAQADARLHLLNPANVGERYNIADLYLQAADAAYGSPELNDLAKEALERWQAVSKSRR